MMKRAFLIILLSFWICSAAQAENLSAEAEAALIAKKIETALAESAFSVVKYCDAGGCTVTIQPK